MVCDDSGLLGDDTFEVQVTANGFSGFAFPTELSFLVIGFVLIGSSYLNDRLRLFRIGGGILVMIMGVVTLYPGYANFNYSNLQGLTIGVSSIGIGFFFLISDAFSFDKQVDHFDQADDGRFHDFD